MSNLLVTKITPSIYRITCPICTAEYLVKRIHYKMYGFNHVCEFGKMSPNDISITGFNSHINCVIPDNVICWSDEPDIIQVMDIPEDA
jgi:hypothetical protein